MTCRWTFAEPAGVWVTGCGLAWMGGSPDPEEHAMAYCPRCGGALVLEERPIAPGLARACRLIATARIEELPSGGAESPSVEVHMGPVVLRVRGDGTVSSVGVGDLEAPRVVASGSGTLREVERG